MANPLISIIIPAYNAEKYITQALESALEQTYTNIEIIIVDDGSTDTTAEIIKEKYQNDARVKLISQKNAGVAVVRNNGIRVAQGEYIAFLDADDYYLPTKIEREIEFLQNHPEFDITYCNMKHFYDDNTGVLYQHQGGRPSGNVFENLLDGFFGQLNTVLIPKKIFEDIGMFDERFRDSEEWDLFLRFAKAGCTFGFLDEDLVRIRINRSSLSRFENQWKMKVHNTQVFEELNASMTDTDRKKYEMPKRLAKLRFILALAYLAAGNKKSALTELGKVQHLSLIKSFSLKILKGSVYMFPASFLQQVVCMLWAYKHKRLFKKTV